jgi:hypothetical protein
MISICSVPVPDALAAIVAGLSEDEVTEIRLAVLAVLDDDNYEEERNEEVRAAILEQLSWAAARLGYSGLI